MILISGKGSEYHRDAVNIVRNVLLIQVPSKSIHPYSWSLVYELYYYFIFGFFVIWLRLNIILCVFFLVTPVLLCHSRSDSDVLWMSYNNIFFAFGLSIGYCFHQKYFWIILYLFFALLVFFGFSMNEFTVFVGLAFLLLFYLILDSSIFILKYIGSASYSIFLCHALIVPIAVRLHFDLNYMIYAIVVFICFGVGIFYHHFVEKKMMAYTAHYIRSSAKVQT